MADYVPTFILYASNGVTPVYTFPLVQDFSGPLDPKDSVVHEGLRGVGAIVIPGSTQSWELPLQFVLLDDNYEGLIAQMTALSSTIAMFTPYILKIGLTPSTTLNYNVKRIKSFEFPGIKDNRILTRQDVVCPLLVHAWA